MKFSTGIEVWVQVTLSLSASQALLTPQQRVHCEVMSPFGRSSWVPPVPPDVLKVPETVLAAFMVSWQEPVPEQAPLQPAKVEPAAGLALRVTAVPSA